MCLMQAYLALRLHDTLIHPGCRILVQLKFPVFSLLLEKIQAHPSAIRNLQKCKVYKLT